MDELATEEHVKRLGRANLPRLPAGAFKSKLDLGLDDQPASLNADVPAPVLDHQPAPSDAVLPEPDLGPDNQLAPLSADLTEPEMGSDNLPAPFTAALELVRTATDALERLRARCLDVEAFAQQEVGNLRAQLATADTVIVELDNKRAAQEDSIQQLKAQTDANIEERQRLLRSLDEMQSAYEQSQALFRTAEERATAAETRLGQLHAELAAAFSDLITVADAAPDGN